MRQGLLRQKARLASNKSDHSALEFVGSKKSDDSTASMSQRLGRKMMLISKSHFVAFAVLISTHSAMAGKSNLQSRK